MTLMCDLVDFVDRHLRGSNGFALTNKTKKTTKNEGHSENQKTKTDEENDEQEIKKEIQE